MDFTSLYSFTISHLPYTLCFIAWCLGGGIQYLIKSYRVKLKPQRIVFSLLCGPLVWFLKSVGWLIDLLDVIFAGFKDWLYANEETKK